MRCAATLETNDLIFSLNLVSLELFIFTIPWIFGFSLLVWGL